MRGKAEGGQAEEVVAQSPIAKWLRQHQSDSKMWGTLPGSIDSIL